MNPISNLDDTLIVVPGHGALQQKEMSNWIGPTVKELWNFAMHVLHKFFGFNINATAFCLGQSSLHLLKLKSSMAWFNDKIAHQVVTNIDEQLIQTVTCWCLDKGIESSVTRFGEISPLWQFFVGFLYCGKIVNLLRQFLNCRANVHCCKGTNIERNNLAIWSPCLSDNICSKMEDWFPQVVLISK